MARKLSALQSIHEFCKTCQGLEKGQHLDPVKDCAAGVAWEGVPPCVLYPYRMGQGNMAPEHRDAARKRMAARKNLVSAV